MSLSYQNVYQQNQALLNKYRNCKAQNQYCAIQKCTIRAFQPKIRIVKVETNTLAKYDYLPIEDLLQHILKGELCVTNFSNLKTWKGFSNIPSYDFLYVLIFVLKGEGKCTYKEEIDGIYTTEEKAQDAYNRAKDKYGDSLFHYKISKQPVDKI